MALRLPGSCVCGELPASDVWLALAAFGCCVVLIARELWVCMCGLFV